MHEDCHENDNNANDTDEEEKRIGRKEKTSSFTSVHLTMREGTNLKTNHDMDNVEEGRQHQTTPKLDGEGKTTQRHGRRSGVVRKINRRGGGIESTNLADEKDRRKWGCDDEKNND